MKDIKKIIYVTDPNDPRTGFISPCSAFGFYSKVHDQKKWWPTVEHYVQAKKFEGTEFEETIREAKTIHALRLLLKPKKRYLIDEDTDEVKTEVVYGSGSVHNSGFTAHYIRADWTSAMQRKFVEQATRAKFRHNETLLQKLIDTGNSSLVDKTTSLKESVIIVTNIRNEYLEQQLNLKKKFFKSEVGLEEDFPYEKLTTRDLEFVDDMIDIVRKISQIEGTMGKIYPGMVEDALYTVCPGNIREKVPVNITSQTESLKWSTLHYHNPYLLSAFETIQSRLSEVDPSQKQKNTPSMILTLFLKWVNCDVSKPVKDKIFELVSKARFSSKKIMFRPVKREYRGVGPSPSRNRPRKTSKKSNPVATSATTKKRILEPRITETRRFSIEVPEVSETQGIKIQK